MIFLLILGAYLALSLGTTVAWSWFFRRAGTLADVVGVQIADEEIAQLETWSTYVTGAVLAFGYAYLISPNMAGNRGVAIAYSVGVATFCVLIWVAGDVRDLRRRLAELERQNARERQ